MQTMKPFSSSLAEATVSSSFKTFPKADSKPRLPESEHLDANFEATSARRTRIDEFQLASFIPLL
jgi:hypothetical protein